MEMPLAGDIVFVFIDAMSVQGAVPCEVEKARMRIMLTPFTSRSGRGMLKSKYSSASEQEQ